MSTSTAVKSRRAVSAAKISLPVPVSNLQRGSRGAAVRQLQAALNSLGFRSGPVDGVFGSVTETALKAFQRSQKIFVDGQYGPQSRGALTRALAPKPTPFPAPKAPTTKKPVILPKSPALNLRRGASGIAVKQLQASLIKLGYKPGPIDGVFGGQTEAALRAFQSRWNIAVDGRFGPQTRRTLANALQGRRAPKLPSTFGKPSENYTRIGFRGVIMNVRTQQMLLKADSYARAMGLPNFSLSQGSYNAGRVKASAGTHDGGGTLDIRTRGYSKASIAKMVLALRRAGFAAWSRGNGHDNMAPHIHAVAIGDRQLSPAARNQVRAYFQGRDGLAGNRLDPDRFVGRPIPGWAAPYR